MARLKGFFKLCAVFLLVSGCAATFENHGYVPSDTDLGAVVVGVDTRDTVATSIGTPTATGVLKDSGYYYVRSRWKSFAYRAPQEIDRQVVAITFDKAGVVENIERFTLKDGRVFALSRRVTDSNIKGVTFLRQLMGNLGNFNAGQFVDGASPP